jgi:hypothetical protein
MKVYDFLAQPGHPCIRVRVGPNLNDVIEVDQAFFDGHKEELLAWCLELPEVEGMHWRTMKIHTEGNGTMAKLLIALGDLVGAWKMHPPRDSVGLWTRQSPRIASVTRILPPRRVPKPSAGELDDTKPCFCCERPMGPPSDYRYDLYADEKGDMCVECVAMGCTMEKGPCKVFPEKVASQAPKKPPEKEEAEFPAAPPVGLEAYLSQFRE